MSDGRQVINAHKRMAWCYSLATVGNTALTAGLDLLSEDGACVVALGFGRNPVKAGHRARTRFLRDCEPIVREYVGGWDAVQSRCFDLGEVGESGLDL